MKFFWFKMGLITQEASRVSTLLQDAFSGYGTMLAFSWNLSPCIYLKYNSLPLVMCLNTQFCIFPSPLSYLAFPAGVGLEGLFESPNYITDFANLPCPFILLLIWLSLQWPPRTINNLILLWPFVLKLGWKSIKCLDAFLKDWLYSLLCIPLFPP